MFFDHQTPHSFDVFVKEVAVKVAANGVVDESLRRFLRLLFGLILENRFVVPPI
jgi:hypothetical protein